jgi:hypothetical protein
MLPLEPCTPLLQTFARDIFCPGLISKTLELQVACLLWAGTPAEQMWASHRHLAIAARPGQVLPGGISWEQRHQPGVQVHGGLWPTHAPPLPHATLRKVALFPATCCWAVCIYVWGPDGGLQ